MNSKKTSGYVVLTAMILIGALATITTIAALYQGTQLLNITSKDKLKQQAYYLAESCAEIGMREAVGAAVAITAQYSPNKQADYYSLDSNNNLYFLKTDTFNTIQSGLNSYCQWSYENGSTNKAIYVIGTTGALGILPQDSKLTLILDANNKLIYRGAGIAAP